MRNILEYLLYCIPVAFILLARVYMLRYRALEGTGKIPDIVSADNKQKLFFALSIITAFMIFVFI